MPASSPAGQRPIVFISYAHESEALRSSVKALAHWLGHKGCNVLTDHAYQYRPPDVGWQAWMLGCIEKAETVLVVCTPKLKLRYEKNAPLDTGRGATYEGAIVTQHLYDNAMRNTKFFPILPKDGHEDDIPRTLKSWWNGHRFPSGNDGIRRMIFAETASPDHIPGAADFVVFRDINEPWCPEMVVLLAGQFLMGSPPDEEGRSDAEGSQHKVTIKYRFALGRYAVTFAEYDHFCKVTAREKPADAGWGRGKRPVINVSWLDAKAYVGWLARDTGQPYRLPSEAEWEYACRAGTATPFSFGGTISPEQANYDGNHTYAGGFKGIFRKKTIPVGSLPPNTWGLHEMHGNVWEWVEDLWHANYSGAPVDGAAWTDEKALSYRRDTVVRGGAWLATPWVCRSASRYRHFPEYRIDVQGFRVARTLD